MYRALNIADRVAEELALASCFNPHALVLQPTGHLNSTNYREFQVLLHTALDQAVDSVVIDFLWIEGVDEYSIQTLVSEIERAAKLGKIISFIAMSQPIQNALETEWDRQRTIRFGSWQDLFGSDLEQFLDEQLPA